MSYFKSNKLKKISQIQDKNLKAPPVKRRGAYFLAHIIQKNNPTHGGVFFKW